MAVLALRMRFNLPLLAGSARTGEAASWTPVRSFQSAYIGYYLSAGKTSEVITSLVLLVPEVLTSFNTSELTCLLGVSGLTEETLA